MNCRHNCPARARRIPPHKLDKVRRRLDFSEGVSEAPPAAGPPADKYGHFKKVSESNSTQDVEGPFYTSSQMAAVPDSFLEMFVPKAPPRSSKKAERAPCQVRESPEPDIPESFLEFCQDRLAVAQQRSTRQRSPYRPTFDDHLQVPPSYPYYGLDVGPAPAEEMVFQPTATSTPKPARTPSPCKPVYEDSLPAQTPYSSYYGYDLPGAPTGGILFNPTVTSTPKQTVYKSPSPYHATGYYPFPYMCYCSEQAPSFGMENYNVPRSPASPPIGLGKFAYPSSRQSPTPPTPSFGCGAANIKTPESTVSTGDLLQCSPKRPSGRPRRRTSTSSLVCGGEKRSDTVCSDDLLKSSNPCQRCPTLGVTPVHSGVSFGSSHGNIRNSRQNISRSIEGELLVRERQERSQLEADLTRWQQARRKLVMNTASMGA